MLADSLKKVISEAYVFYFKAHTFHWNVEGSDFAQYHGFLGDLYEDIFDSIDTYSELIRTLNVYAPTSLAKLIAQASLEEASGIPDGLTMLNMLKRDNDVFLATLIAAYDEAEKANEFGISNFLQDRIQAHEKHAWMLRSFTK
jgi:starvation-inducible DNA-binding protein